MALPNKYQNGSVDSSVKGVYRASPVKLMIYGNGKLRKQPDFDTRLLFQEQVTSSPTLLQSLEERKLSSSLVGRYTRRHL